MDALKAVLLIAIVGVVLLLLAWFALVYWTSKDAIRVITEPGATVRPFISVSDASQEVIDSVGNYSSSVEEVDVETKPSNVYVRVAVALGTTQIEAEAILDHAFDLLNEVFDAGDFSFSVYVHDPDDGIAVSVHQDPAVIFRD